MKRSTGYDGNGQKKISYFFTVTRPSNSTELDSAGTDGADGGGSEPKRALIDKSAPEISIGTRDSSAITKYRRVVPSKVKIVANLCNDSSAQDSVAPDESDDSDSETDSMDSDSSATSHYRQKRAVLPKSKTVAELLKESKLVQELVDPDVAGSTSEVVNSHSDAGSPTPKLVPERVVKTSLFKLGVPQASTAKQIVTSVSTKVLKPVLVPERVVQTSLSKLRIPQASTAKQIVTSANQIATSGSTNVVKPAPSKITSNMQNPNKKTETNNQNCVESETGEMVSRSQNEGSSKEPEEGRNVTPRASMTKVVKKSYERLYQSVWEKDTKFQGWLQPVQGDDTKASCKICNGTELRAHKHDLEQHMKSKNHEKKTASLKIQKPVTECGEYFSFEHGLTIGGSLRSCHQDTYQKEWSL